MTSVSGHHGQWFLTITELLSEVGMEPSVPRRCGRQIHRSNVPADTPSEYYRRTISIPVLDHLLSELGAWFGSHQRTALQGLSIVPSVAVSFEPDDYASRLKALCDLYENDLPSPQSFESELNCWLMKWKQIGESWRKQLAYM